MSINNPGGELKAEMTANAEIILDEHHNVLMVPEASLMYDKDKNASVDIPDPSAKDGMRKIPVKIGISNGVKTEVVAGLKQGDQVCPQNSENPPLGRSCGQPQSLLGELLLERHHEQALFQLCYSACCCFRCCRTPAREGHSIGPCRFPTRLIWTSRLRFGRYHG